MGIVMNQQDLLFQADEMYKSFGITKALNNVNLKLYKGQILGLIGENGSGKSTLTSIIAAIQPADSGKMYKTGQPYSPKTTVEANKSGVCMILQEKGTFDQLTVAKNIFIGKEDMFSKNGIINNRKMNQEAQKILDDIKASHIRAEMSLGRLNFEDCKLVELARAMYMNPQILIVDETTTALSRTGRDILYEIMENMKKEKKGVIFISHDIDELLEKCDALTILRDGIYVDTLERKQFDAGEIKRLMVGREVADNYYRTDLKSCKNKEVVFQFKDIQTDSLKDVSFELHKGEILGFGGLADCGMHDIGKVAFGLLKPAEGAATTENGENVKNPAQAMNKKIAYISKNRDQEALMVSSNIKDNICLASYPKLLTGPLVLPASEKKFVDKWATDLEIKMQNSSQYVMELSGGNKQKVALAKWLGFGADIFILDCPTRGIDIGVKSNIYQLMIKLRAEGKSIILISEELPEVIGMSDRTIILKDGKISGEFVREEEITETKLIDYMV